MMRIIKVWSSMPSEGLIKDVSRVVKMIIHALKKRSYGPEQLKKIRREDVFNKTHQNMSDRVEVELAKAIARLEAERTLKKSVSEDINDMNDFIEQHNRILRKLRKDADGNYLDLT